MNTEERFIKLMDYLNNAFSGGETSISGKDVIDDNGTLLQDEVAEVLDLIRIEKISIEDGDLAVNALDTFSDAWGQGFELASGDDWVTDDQTVSDIVEIYAESLERKRQVSPAL